MRSNAVAPCSQLDGCHLRTVNAYSFFKTVLAAPLPKRTGSSEGTRSGSSEPVKFAKTRGVRS
jgi:hypothetical protein